MGPDYLNDSRTCRPIHYQKKMSDEFPALEGEVPMEVPAGEGEPVPVAEEEAARPLLEKTKVPPLRIQLWIRRKLLQGNDRLFGRAFQRFQAIAAKIAELG